MGPLPARITPLCAALPEQGSISCTAFFKTYATKTYTPRISVDIALENHDTVETFELYNATQAWNEGGGGVDGVDLSTHSKYRYLMEIGLRLLHESRDRCK